MRRCSASTRSRMRCSPTPPNISAGACCASRCGSRRSQVAVLLALCAALVLLVRFVGGAPLPRWTYFVPPLVGALLWPLAVGAAADGRSGRALVGDLRCRRTLRPQRAERSHDPLPRSRSAPAARSGGAAASASPELRNPERELFLFRRRLSLAGRCSCSSRSAGCSRASSTCRSSSTSHYQTLAEIEPHRDRADRAQPRRHHRPQRRRARAELFGVHARDHAVAREEPRRRRSTQLAEIVDIQPRDRKRFRKLLDESKNFESLPLRTRLTDEEVARFAVNRYRFPGVEIKARLFRQYPFGEVASHVVGYIGRINDRTRAHRRVGRDRELQGLRLHRQGRHRAVVRARVARHDRRRGGRGRRRRPRGAHAVAHAADRRATT